MRLQFDFFGKAISDGVFFQQEAIISGFLFSIFVILAAVDALWLGLSVHWRLQNGAILIYQLYFL